MLFIGGAVFAQNMVTLDQAISYGISEIETRLEQGVRVMVLNFRSPSERLSNYVLDEMTVTLTRNGELTVVERENLDFLLRELRYERSGNISDESAQSIGRILGAQYVVSGVIEESSANYVVQFKTMPVEPAALQTLTRIGVVKDAQIANLLGADTFGSRSAGASTLTATGSSNVVGADTSDGKVPNARINWVSGEVNFLFGLGGVRYERMLSSNSSVGLNAYWSVPFLLLSELGIDAYLRYYPWGKTFFVGAGLGFHRHIGSNLVVRDDHEYQALLGGAVTPEVGWKIDVGEVGGFYLQPGIKYPITFGTIETETNGRKFAIGYPFLFPVVYLGMGGSFGVPQRW